MTEIVVAGLVFLAVAALFVVAPSGAVDESGEFELEMDEMGDEGFGEEGFGEEGFGEGGFGDEGFDEGGFDEEF
ncbi:MAG: hypothetical protein ABEL76_04890 [Bradymonadaceae bacterium]